MCRECKGPFTQAIFVAQLKAIFVAPKLNGPLRGEKRQCAGGMTRVFTVKKKTGMRRLEKTPLRRRGERHVFDLREA